MPNSDCAILVPIASSLEPQTEAALRVLVDRGYVVRTLRGTADVVLARCSLATEALRDGFKETLWIDSDIDFIPDDVDKIRQKGPFVAGLYVRKTKTNPGFAAKFKPDTPGVCFGPNGSVIDMQYVGMGFTYIRAAVYEAIAEKFGMTEVEGGYDGKTVVPYFLPYLADEGRDCLCYLAEDYSFSHRAWLAGYTPQADTRIDLGHIGKYTYSVRDLLDAKPDAKPTEETTMNEQELLARIGRMQLVAEQQDLAYSQLLNLLAGVVHGDIDRSRLLINLTDRTWQLAKQGEQPPLPATINGFPVCVTAEPIVAE